MKTAWGDVIDAHAHFFSHTLFATLAKGLTEPLPRTSSTLFLGKNSCPFHKLELYEIGELPQPGCFGRLHVGRFKSRRWLYSGVEV